MSTAAETRRRELGEIRERLVGVVREVAGPGLTAVRARELLERARAWGSGNARELDDHLGVHPDTFTAPSPHCPLSVDRLLKLLTAEGFGDKVVLLGCARCGRTDKLLKCRTPEGRCCERCLERVNRRLCARCGKLGRIVRRRPEPICNACYRVDPARQVECARCGRTRVPTSRTDTGAPLCHRCTPKPKRPCGLCGRTAEILANTPKGPVCKNCYTSPPRECGVCGQVRPIRRRGDGDGRPDACYRCAALGECAGCGKRRSGSRYQGGPFYCATCRPRTPQPCALCGRDQLITAVWPLGPVCQRCYRTSLDRPAPCAECHVPRILVCVNDFGLVCTRCGRAEMTFTCRECGAEGPGFRDGRCYRCLLVAKIHALLGNDGDRTARARPPVFEALTGLDPGSLLTLFRNGKSLAVLTALAASGAEITHDALDALPQDARTHHVRELFVSAGLLARREEALIQLQLWVEATVAGLPTRHQPIIRAYAEWHILRRARRKAARTVFRDAAHRSNRCRIGKAITFLNWLDSTGYSLGQLTQTHVETYFEADPTNWAALVTFLRWAQQRGIISGIELTGRRDGLPQQFQDHEHHAEQLRRCLTDDSLPLALRVTGALVRLYAIPVVRVVELTTDRFYRDDTGAYLVLDHHGVAVPPSLARLIEELIVTARSANAVHDLDGAGTMYLMPGRPPSRPLNPMSLRRRLNESGLPTRAARNTAMIANVADLDAVVVADLFGIRPTTAHRWAQYAQASWACYLAARATNPPAPEGLRVD